MRFGLLLLALLFLKSIYSQESFLRINPQGHQGMIRDIAISNDGKYVISASFDKSIKKWNINTGKVEKEFRSYIGVGSEGMVYYVSLSPDNKYLATCGWFGADDETEIVGDIRVFDFKTGKMAFVLKGLQNTPVGLGFSSDSKYIIAGDCESNVFKWDISTKEIVADFSYHSKEYGKELARLVVNGNFFITAGYDGKFCLWDIAKSGKPIKEDKKFFKESLFDDIQDVAISANGNEIAVGLNNYILIYNSSLKPYFIIENKEKPGFIKFSDDGTRLLTGCVKSGEGDKPCYIFEKNGNEWAEYSIFNYHQQSVIAGGFISKDELVTAGGERDEICYWITKEKGESPKIKKLMHGLGQTYNSVALSDSKLAYSNKWTANQGMSKFEKVFDLFDKTISTDIDENAFNKPVQKFKNYDLTTYNEGGYSIINPNLVINENGKATDTIKRPSWFGSRHNVYTFSNDGIIISAGSQGVMVAYDIKGHELNYFVGHESDIWGASISKDGTKLITCGADQTIIIWPLEKLGVENPSPIMKSVWDYMIEMQVDDVYHKILESYSLDKIAKEQTKDSWQQVIDGLKKRDYPVNFLEKKLYEYKSQIIYPLSSIFIAENGEWVIWNEKGYFSASKKGAQYVGYHINIDKNSEARFYPFGQFDIKFNRPDIILKDLSFADENTIEFYHQAYLKRLKKMGLTEDQLSDDIHLPELEIIDYHQDGNKLKMQISAKDTKYKIERLNVYINDVPVFGARGKKLNLSSEIYEDIELEIPNGLNTIEVSVLNNKGVESLRENITTSVEEKIKPDLYLVCIGTSDYANNSFDLKYASKDAKDFSNVMLGSENYNKIHNKLLIDNEVTKENILNIKDFIDKAGVNDVVIVFIAGHGVLDKNLDYYYGTYNMDFNNPIENGIVYSDIENLLDGITALKKLLIMDTCHSGEVDKDDVELVADANTEKGEITFRAAGVGVRKAEANGLQVTAEIVKELFSDIRRGTGATVISSAGGAEYAMESATWQNGLFTYCLLAGIKNSEADLNNDNIIMLSELQMYLHKRVKKLSKGKQIPTSRIENISLDFPIK